MIKSLFMGFAALALCAQAFSATTTTTNYKMYRSMYPKVSPNCDIHTEMNVTEEAGVIKEVTLTEKVSGVCEIHVTPNARTYKLEINKLIVDGNCGSVYYIKEVHDDLVVRLADHRKRRCEHPTPNNLVISEKNYDEVGKTLYSLDF